jgi:hypothetical protein
MKSLTALTAVAALAATLLSTSLLASDNYYDGSYKRTSFNGTVYSNHNRSDRSYRSYGKTAEEIKYDLDPGTFYVETSTGSLVSSGYIEEPEALPAGYDESLYDFDATTDLTNCKGNIEFDS